MWKRKWRVAISVYGILLSIVGVGVLITVTGFPNYEATSVWDGIFMFLVEIIVMFALLLILTSYSAVVISYGFLVHLLATKCSERFEGKIRLLTSFFVHLIFCLISNFFIRFLVYFYPDPYSVFFSPTANPDPHSVFSFFSFTDLGSIPFRLIYLIVVVLIGMFVVGEVLHYLDQRNSHKMIKLLTWGPVSICIILIATIIILLFVGIFIHVG